VTLRCADDSEKFRQTGNLSTGRSLSRGEVGSASLCERTKRNIPMVKKILTGLAIATLAASGTVALSAPAQAREGATSVGHGVKCYWVLGVQFCYRGV
jgi:hypothetical protein